MTIIDTHGRGTLIPLRDLQRFAGAALSETEKMPAALHIPVDRLRREREAEQAQTILEGTPRLDEARAGALDEAIQLTAQFLDSAAADF